MVFKKKLNVNGKPRALAYATYRSFKEKAFLLDDEKMIRMASRAGVLLNRFDTGF